MKPGGTIPIEAIRAFCERWGVVELALFGSVARGEAGPDSDVDVMLVFAPGRGFSFENTPIIHDELRAIFGREVDVVDPGSVRNPIRLRSMMARRKVLYAA